jgi:hypothetical protein
MSNYPPGVTGNEPQITGEWPCQVCGGWGFDDENEDGKHTCMWCLGSGIQPEDPTVEQIRYLAEFHNRGEAREYVYCMATKWLDRNHPGTRKYLRESLEAVRWPKISS